MAFCFSCYSLKSQEVKQADLPPSVSGAFEKLFSGAKSKQWERSKYGFYEVEFKWNKTNTRAAFNSTGLLQYTSTQLKTSKIPEKIKLHAVGLYALYSIKEAYRITTPDEKLMYQLIITKGNDQANLFYNSNYDYLGEDYLEIINKPIGME
jgi:hypothetical protein